MKFNLTAWLMSFIWMGIMFLGAYPVLVWGALVALYHFDARKAVEVWSFFGAIAKYYFNIWTDAIDGQNLEARNSRR